MISTNKFRIKIIKKTTSYGKFVLSPLVKGFGHTLGNTLRRVLYITIPGAAITKIKVAGANHLFTTLPGVKEDLVGISMNLKQINFTYSGDEPVNLSLSKKGPGKVLAKDIGLTPDVEVANPDQLIATLADKKSSLNIELTVEQGYSYVSAKDKESNTIGEIFLDANFSPIQKVSYEVEPARLGKKDDHDRLILEIWTNGAIGPKRALELAVRDLVSALTQIINPQDFEEEVLSGEGAINPNSDYLVEEIDLPLRVTNALKKAGYDTVKDLSKATRAEVAKAKNVGEKSLKLIDKWLEEKSLTW